MRDSERIFGRIQEGPADAMAWLRGSQAYEKAEGCIYFYDMGRETLVVASICGLEALEKECGNGFLGFHIHSEGHCTGTPDDPFANSGMHYNPYDCPHPFHAGDLPSILISSGRAFMAVLTSGFTVEQVKGRTVILHAQADDFRTQPSGDSGAKIACGTII